MLNFFKIVERTIQRGNFAYKMNKAWRGCRPSDYLAASLRLCEKASGGISHASIWFVASELADCILYVRGRNWLRTCIPADKYGCVFDSVRLVGKFGYEACGICTHVRL